MWRAIITILVIVALIIGILDFVFIHYTMKRNQITVQQIDSLWDFVKTESFTLKETVETLQHQNALLVKLTDEQVTSKEYLFKILKLCENLGNRVVTLEQRPVKSCTKR